MPPPPPPPPPPREMGMMSREQNRPILVVMNVINSITHILLGAVACSAFLLVEIGVWSTSFTQHIYLCVTGYVILMSVAIMSFDPNTSWSRCLKYPERKLSHMVLQIAGSILAITGSIIRIVNYNNNFSTTHGILGFVAMILTILSLVGGVLNIFLSGNNNRLLIKTVHSCFGSITLVIAFTCLSLGLDNVFRATFGNNAANVCISIVVFALAGVILPPTINTFNRIFNN